MTIRSTEEKIMFSEEILTEIDITLDKLIENAAAMKNTTLLKEEVEAFQKTQESLLEHLMHMDKLLEEKRKILKIPNPEQRKKIINQKLNQFEKLNSNFIKNASEKIRLIKKGKK
jgi:hypothetical protein